MVFSQKPTSYSLENVKIVAWDDTLFFSETIDQSIPSFKNKTVVELIKNDSLKIDLIIKYTEKSSNINVRKTKHVFYYQNKRLRKISLWKTDLPFLTKLTGIGWKWESKDKNQGIKTESSIVNGSAAKLPRRKGEIKLVCKETLFFK